MSGENGENYYKIGAYGAKIEKPNAERSISDGCSRFAEWGLVKGPVLSLGVSQWVFKKMK